MHDQRFQAVFGAGLGNGSVKIKSAPESIARRTKFASGSLTKATTGMNGWPPIMLRRILRIISKI